jgi:hypothetical protein
MNGVGANHLAIEVVHAYPDVDRAHEWIAQSRAGRPRFRSLPLDVMNRFHPAATPTRHPPGDCEDAPV